MDKKVSFARRDKIVQLAEEIRQRYDPTNIDDVAKTNSLILVRTPGAEGRDAGFAYVHYTQAPLYIESLARPEEELRVWGNSERNYIRSIVINTNAGIPEAEIFWHEWYHLFYSPLGIQRSERFEHHYSTEGAVHNQEERRADEFAAAVLIPSIEGLADIHEIVERYHVSERLASIAVKFYSLL